MQAVLAAVARGELKAGEVHSLESLAQRLDVSRTPVRDAMLRLEEAGVVKMVPRRGAMILAASPDDQREIAQLLAWLQIPATRAAAERATEADVERIEQLWREVAAAADRGDRISLEAGEHHLHRAILELAGNSRALAVLDQLHDVMARSRTSSFDDGTPAALQVRSNRLHSVVEAFRAGDPDRAATAIASYIGEPAVRLVERSGGPSHHPKK